MYLKNSSPTRSICFNTVAGKVGIKPGECIELNVKMYPPMPSALVQISKEEYLTFRQAKEQANKPMEEVETESVSTVGQQDTELDKNDEVDVIEDTTDKPEEKSIETTIEDALKDPGIMDFVRSLLNKGMLEQPKPGENIVEQTVELKPEPKKEIKPQPALQVKSTKKEDVEKSIDDQIKELEETWVQTKNARKKEKLAKQIQELKKQAKKLESQKGDE